jgi:peptide-methionine (S)-S-oxide reductase
MPRLLSIALALAATTMLAVSATCVAGEAGDPENMRDPARGIAPASTDADGHGVALFAGGCFWCVESVFDEHKGVISAVSGYAGGEEIAPTYKDVGYGRTHHTEVVRVVYDPAVVTYAELLDVFWHQIDPFQTNGQFCDKGEHYRSAVFALDADQRKLAEETKAAHGVRFDKTIATHIYDGHVFWPAEEYHQDFHVKNPVHYLSYRTGCGRDRRIEEVWGSTAKH